MNKKDMVGPMKILAVDDDEIILELLKEVVGAAGFPDITLVTSGAEALKTIQNSPTRFDCFLLDIQMPEMDGIELCNHIRKFPAYRSAPILMITAMADRQYIDRAFAAGASDYVTKPFDVLELGTRVNLAARLVQEHAAAEDKSFALEALRDQIETKNSVAMSEEIRIEGVAGVIGKLAFENYLLQLTRGGLFGSCIVAFQVANISTIHQHSSGSDFANTIIDIAEAISDNLRRSEFFLSYRGNGQFVAICHKVVMDTFNDLPGEIAMSIRDMELVYDNGAKMDVQLVMGQPVKCGFFSSKSTLEPLYKAVDAAEAAARSMRRHPGNSGWSSKIDTIRNRLKHPSTKNVSKLEMGF
ncbi:response regulator [Neptunicoccus sediminis]|uniref:response regulator n=1 Tax=Neptunicoccus sediminis TaxID=1892596 RepID=UPI000A3FFB06|nr:response regulator [Neptunicoccus sediminis]